MQMPTKREVYRLDLPGNHLTNWMVDEAAKAASPPMMPMGNGGIAKVEPSTVREGLDNMYYGMLENHFSKPEIEKAKSQVLEELDSVPDHVDEVEYITMR